MVIILLTLSFLIGPTASAEAPKAPARQKVIDFDDSLVEGVNKQPWDSFSQLSQAQRSARKSHLYRKRKGFRAETLQTLARLGNQP